MAEPVLCLLATCRVPGRQHRDGCDGERCTCLRAQAADGLRLCALHTRRIGGDATDLATLHGELALRLLGGTGHGEPVSGTPDDTRVPNPAAVEMRTEIRHVLVGWCRLIAEERGWWLPLDSVTAMGEYVARSAEWLAATEYADEVATELAELRSRAWGIAYPSGTRVIDIAPCPMMVTVELPEHDWSGDRPWCTGCGLPPGPEVPPHCVPRLERCPGTVRAVLRATDALLPSVLACDADDEHRWGAAQWHAFGRAVKARVA